MELLWVLVVTIVFTSQAFRSNVGSNRWQSHRELSRRYENFPTSRTSSTSSSNNQPRSKFTSSPRVNQPDKERIKRSRGQESDEDEDDDGEDSVKEPNAHLDARQNSWKILAKKLETSKNTTTIFGKQVTNNPNNQKIPTTTDLLQCPHFNECAGCTQTSDFTKTPIMQRAKKFMQSQNIPFQIQVGGYLQWRTLVKLAVQPMSKWGGLRFGLYKAGSHDVLSIPQCKVHHPKINEASEFVRLAALDAGVSGYTPATAKQDSSGDLRYLQFSVSRHTGKVQLVLVWNAENYKSSSASLQRFVKRLKSRDDLFHSIHINFHVGRNNNIFDYEEKNWKLLWGPQVMKEKIGKGTFSFLPQIFKQANIDFFESAIIPYVSRFVPQDSKVAELYAGIGIIGLNVADRAKEVLLSDSNPFVEQVFDECVESFDETVQEKVYYDCFDADSAIEKGQCDDVDVIIVDPPRKGLNEGVLKFFTGKDAEKKLGKQRRLIYVGCGYEAVERDTKDLVASGNWVIKAAEGFALFPGSDHIETVIVFDRKK